MPRKDRSASVNAEQERGPKKSGRQASDATASGKGKQKAKGAAAPASRGKPKKGKNEDEAYRPPRSVGVAVRKSARLSSRALPATPEPPSIASSELPPTNTAPQISLAQDTSLADADEGYTMAKSGGDGVQAQTSAAKKPASRIITGSDFLPDRKAGLRVNTLFKPQSMPSPHEYSDSRRVTIHDPETTRGSETEALSSDEASTEDGTSGDDSADCEVPVVRSSESSAKRGRKGEKTGSREVPTREAIEKASSRADISAPSLQKKRKVDQAEGDGAAKRQRSNMRSGDAGKNAGRKAMTAPAAKKSTEPDSPMRRSDQPPLFRPLSESSAASSAPPSHSGLAAGPALNPDLHLVLQAELDSALTMAVPAASRPALVMHTVPAQQVYPRPLSNITEIDELLTDEESAQLSMATLYPERQHTGAKPGVVTHAEVSEPAPRGREYVLDPTYDLQEDPTFLATPEVVVGTSQAHAAHVQYSVASVKTACVQPRQETPSAPSVSNPELRVEDTAMCAAEDLHSAVESPSGSLHRTGTVPSMLATASTALILPSTAVGTPLRRSSRGLGPGGSAMKVGSYSETRQRRRKPAEDAIASTETSSSRTTLQFTGARKKPKTSVSRPGAEGEHRRPFKLPVRDGTAATARPIVKVPKHVKRNFRFSGFKPTSTDQLSPPVQSNLLAPGSWLKPTASGDQQDSETPGFFLACGNTPFDTSASRFPFDDDNNGNPYQRRSIQPRSNQLEDDGADDDTGIMDQERLTVRGPVAEGEDPLHMLLRAAQMISLAKPSEADDTEETRNRISRRGLLNPLPVFDKDLRVPDASRLELLADVAAMRERLPVPGRSASASSDPSGGKDLPADPDGASPAGGIPPNVYDQQNMTEEQAEQPEEEQMEHESEQQSEPSMPQHEARSNHQLSPDDESAPPLHNRDAPAIAQAVNNIKAVSEADEQTDQRLMLEHTAPFSTDSSYQDEGPICPGCPTGDGLPVSYEHGECYRTSTPKTGVGETEHTSTEEPSPPRIKLSHSPAFSRTTPDLPGSRPRRARRTVLQASSPHKSPTSAHRGAYVPPSRVSSCSSGSKGRGSSLRSSSVVARRRSHAPSPSPSSLYRTEGGVIGLIRSFKADPVQFGKSLVHNARTPHRPRTMVTRSVVAKASVTASRSPASAGVESKGKANAVKENKRSQKSLKSAASSLPGDTKSSTGLTAASMSSGPRRTKR